jgi:hypothetical protein
MPARRHWRAPVAAAGIVTAFIAGSAVATTPGDRSTSGSFVPVNHRVLNAVSVGTGHATSPVVIGGSTTVPTDATAVRLLISVKSTGAGELQIYPAGNSAGDADDTVSWNGTKGGGGEVYENVGGSNEVAFFNRSSRAIYLTVTITGYTAKGTVYYSGPVSAPVPTSGEPWTPQVSFVVPTGTYLLAATGTIEYTGAPAGVDCSLVDTNGSNLNTASVDVNSDSANNASFAVQGVITMPGAWPVALRCHGIGQTSRAELIGAVVTATPVGVGHQR